MLLTVERTKHPIRFKKYREDQGESLGFLIIRRKYYGNTI